MTDSTGSAVFVLPHYDVHGRITATSSRALDVMNDHSTRFLKLDSVRVCGPGCPEPLLELPHTVVLKNLVQAVLLFNEDRTSESKVYFASLARKTQEATILLPTMFVKGRVHSKAGGDMLTFLSLETGIFFPVTNAQVRYGEHFATSLDCQVVLVQKDRIATITATST